MNTLKRISKLLIVLTITLCFVITIENTKVSAEIPDNINENQLDLNVKAAIAIDSKNGQILYAKNSNQKLPVASMSKLITIYLTLDAIKKGKLTWSQKIVPDQTAIKVSQNPDYSNVPLKKGHSYTIKQLYQATLIESANAAAMTLAKAVGGNQKDFVDLMRQQLIVWKIKKAKIYTPDGLPNYTSGKDAYPVAKKNAENSLSAADMAIVANKLLSDFPEVIKTTSKTHLNFDDGNKKTLMTNWNWMLPGMPQYDSAYPLDGLKTGTTDAAGACFTGTMIKQGRRIITVIIGAQHLDGNDPSRFTETKNLLNYIDSNYQLYILKKGYSFKQVPSIKVPNGKTQIVNVHVKKATGIWLKSLNKNISFSPKELDAPLSSGKEVGQYKIGGIYSIKTGKTIGIPATVKSDVQKANIFVRIWRNIF